MKIKIMSIHSAHNYGSVLQAYALQETLKEYSDNVKIIDYRPNYFEERYKLFSIGIYKHYKKSILNIIKYFIGRTVLLPIRYKKFKKFKSFIDTKYELTRRYTDYQQLVNDIPEADVYFCGSDQVWNTDITEGFDLAYYLDFVKIGIRSTYAASIARKKLDSKYESEYKKYIAKFDYISLREETSIDLIRNFTDKSIYITLDPTLLISENKWVELASDSKINICSKYILVYMLEENIELIKIVNKISKTTGYNVVSFNKIKKFKNEKYRFPWAGPEDFLKLFKDAEIVVSNSFHGTVFSTIFKKNFYIVPHTTRGNRMIDLMEKLELSSRIIYNESELNIDKILKNIDYTNTKRKLVEEIENSKQYIDMVLRGK